MRTMLSRHAGTWSGPFILLVALATYACGDGGSSGVGPDDTVAGVTITPVAPRIAPGGTAQLVATPSGVWTFTETFSDPALSLSCTDQATMTLTQTGGAFTGEAQQAGTCMLGNAPYDNSGTFAMTDGLVQQAAIQFSEPGQPTCEYQGTLTADPPTSATGTVSCQGDVSGLGHVSATGTWQITR